MIDRAGEPWFVAADVCQAIGIMNTAEAAEKLDPDEKGTEKIRTLGGPLGQIEGSQAVSRPDDDERNTLILNEGQTTGVMSV